MKPVTTETVKAEIERLEKSESLSMREEFHLYCLRDLLPVIEGREIMARKEHADPITDTPQNSQAESA